MGQAKQRGTYEQRVAQAIEKQTIFLNKCKENFPPKSKVIGHSHKRSSLIIAAMLAATSDYKNHS